MNLCGLYSILCLVIEKTPLKLDANLEAKAECGRDGPRKCFLCFKKIAILYEKNKLSPGDLSNQAKETS